MDQREAARDRWVLLHTIQTTKLKESLPSIRMFLPRGPWIMISQGFQWMLSSDLLSFLYEIGSFFFFLDEYGSVFLSKTLPWFSPPEAWCAPRERKLNRKSNTTWMTDNWLDFMCSERIPNNHLNRKSNSLYKQQFDVLRADFAYFTILTTQLDASFHSITLTWKWSQLPEEECCVFRTKILTCYGIRREHLLNELQEAMWVELRIHSGDGQGIKLKRFICMFDLLRRVVLLQDIYDT